jgi:type IV pilus assembly protein PilY1
MKKLSPAIYISSAAFIYANVLSASPIPLAHSPLFLSNPQKANVLVILDNSNSMDEDASGAAVGSDSPNSKSEIARQAVRNLVSTYTGKINMGLMAYQQQNVVSMNLDNSPYDVSYNPANYDPTFTGARDSTTKRFRLEEPDNPGFFIYYNVALPFYYPGSPGSTSYCYSITANAFNDNEVFPTGPWDIYRCFTHKNAGSPAAQRSDTLDDSAAGYSNHLYTAQFSPTDSDLAQGITDFGARMASVYIGPTWFSNNSPGRGYLHIPIAELDSTQAAQINTKIAVSRFSTNGPTNPSLPLQNAGLTPIEGTLLTAKDYFEGNLSAADEGGPQAAPQESCGKNFIALMTDGLPSTDKDGNTLSDPSTAIADASAAAASLLGSSIGVTGKGIETYVIGFALPFGVNPTTLNDIAAAGGTGSAYLANDPASLQTAFDSIFTDILAKTGASSSTATNSTSLTQNSVIYQARFNSGDWSGQLLAKSIDSNGTISSSALWDTGSVINTQLPDTRQIITFSRDDKDGIAFRWTNIAAQSDTTQKDYLNKDANSVIDNLGSDRVSYLRGADISGFRTRSSKLGDIIDSTPYYVGPPDAGYTSSQMPGYQGFRSNNISRSPFLYVGANDGMLHAIDASDGSEKLAYVPGMIYAHLSDLTDPDYGKTTPTHQYNVDGAPMIADANFGDNSTPDWRTVLVGGLNAGGQGYYALDITDPDDFTEAKAADIVLWEFTDEDDADLGFTFNQPVLNRKTLQSGQIARMNDDRWAVIFGNGYNNTTADGNASSTGHAALFIVFLTGPTGTGNSWQLGTDYIKLDTQTGNTTTPNGLSTPRPVDTDNDGRVDSIYAGDLQGNLWKFDVSSSTLSDWDAAYKSGPNPIPLFTAKDSSGNSQPITTAPLVIKNPTAGYIISFATGKYLGIDDLTDTSTQSLYGIYDNGSVISSRSDLVEQTVLGTGVSNGIPARIISQNSIDYNTKKGWYLDLPESGERVAFNPIQPSENRFAFTTLIPDSALCANGGKSWLMVLDPFTGGQLQLSPFSNHQSQIAYTDNSGNTQSDYVSGLAIADIMTAPTVIKDLPNNRIFLVGNTSSGNLQTFQLTAGNSSQRKSWREIFQ